MSNVNTIIDKTHFKTLNHVKDHVQKQLPNTDTNKIKKVLSTRLKDIHVKRDRIKPYMIKIFSSTTNTWFHDLYDNLKDHTPRYWHIFIGTNNRYVVALPLNDKRASSINKTLSEFINKYHPVKLTSDEEPGIIANVKLFKDNKVMMHVVQDKNHSTLGIIDRFMRTLRDMNTPSEKSKHQSHEEKYTFITPHRMEKFLNTYNNTYHSAIKCTPQEMFNDINLEKEYILKCLDKADKQKRIKNLYLPVGSYVRYILPRHDGISKKRYQVSKECYKIDERRGHMYTLIAKDGTVITKPRFQLIPSKDDKAKFANTIPNRWNGNIEKILDYNPKTNKYKVQFSVPNADPYIDTIPASYLRGATPTVMSDLEKVYYKAYVKLQ